MYNKEKLLDIREKPDGRVLVGDGALGTLLADRSLDQPCNIANLTDAPVVRALHEEYLCTCARIIETATLLANRVALTVRNLEGKMREINVEGAHLGREAVGSLSRGEDTFILGYEAYPMPPTSMGHLAGDVIESSI